MMIVADGMGGHEGGEVASALAVATMVQFLSPERRQAMKAGTEDVAPGLRGAVIAAHERVREQNHDGHDGMGATLLVAMVVGHELHTCHVGDVRCYLRTRSGFHQITRDHSVVGDLVSQGHLTPEQARLHPNKNEVLQAVGMPRELAPETSQRALDDGDCVLLCSDGLWEGLSDEEIGTILNWEGSVRQRATQLVDRGNDAGGRDNTTVVLYEHHKSAGSQ
jgi:protein phosphatase